MAGRVSLLAFFLASFVIIVHCDSKYSKSANEDIDTYGEFPFRMNKVNLVWQKATKRLTSHQLKEFHKDLKIQDKLELEAKKRKAGNDDDDGEYSAIVDKKFHDLLKRYHLLNLDHMRDSNKIENETWETEVADVDMEHLKMNKKLQKLWLKAQTAGGFSEEQLSDLKKELIHHQRKMDEYEMLKNDINTMDNDISENSSKHGKNYKKLNKAMKEQFRQLKEEYLRFEQMTDKGDSGLEFNDPKVVELWSMAKKANLSQMELQSIQLLKMMQDLFRDTKEELKHFEHKLQKHEVYKSQLDSVTVAKPGKENSARNVDQDYKLVKKVQEYGQKIKKLHSDLKMRLGKALDKSEL